MKFLVDGRGQCLLMGEGAAGENGGGPPTFQLMGDRVPESDLGELKSGYSASCPWAQPERSGIHGESKKSTSLASPASAPHPSPPVFLLTNSGLQAEFISCSD